METNIITFYKDFINTIKPFIKNQSVFDIIDNFNDEQINNNIQTFHSNLENDELFKSFIKYKIKIFSTKSQTTTELSNSLFGEGLPLKKLLNNQGEHRKNIIWEHLHFIYHLYEKENQNRQERLSVLKYKDISFSDKFKSMIGDNQNDKTKNFLDKIINSVESDCHDNNQQGMPSMDKIIKLATEITSDFKDDFENGEIDLQGLMSNLMGGIGMDQNTDINNLMNNMMGGMFNQEEDKEEQVVIDENFSTDQVELGEQEEVNPGLQNMLNSINSMGLGDINFSEMQNMMGGLGDIQGMMDNEDFDEEKMNDLMNNMLGSLNINGEDGEGGEFKKLMDEMMNNEIDSNDADNEDNDESYIEEIDEED